MLESTKELGNYCHLLQITPPQQHPSGFPIYDWHHWWYPNKVPSRHNMPLCDLPYLLESLDTTQWQSLQPHTPPILASWHGKPGKRMYCGGNLIQKLPREKKETPEGGDIHHSIPSHEWYQHTKLRLSRNKHLWPWPKISNRPKYAPLTFSLH